MTPGEFKAIREQLGLSQAQLAELLGYAARERIAEFETEARRVPRLLERLMRAYAAGYRPADWPTEDRRKFMAYQQSL